MSENDSGSGSGRKGFVRDVVRPLRDKEETVYVLNAPMMKSTTFAERHSGGGPTLS